MHRRPPALALLTAAALAAGCGERAEPLGALPQSYPVTVRGAGDEPTVLAAPPRRIVALDRGSAALLGRLGVGSRLVGAPGRAPRIARGNGQIDVGAVVALEPDLIVATAAANALDVAEAREETGAAVYVQPSASVVDVQRGTIELGFLVGEAAAARRLVGEMRREIARIEARLKGVPPVRVFADAGFSTPVRERSLLADLVRRAGGRLVPEPAAAEGLRACEIAALEPDVILSLSDNPVNARAFARAVRRCRPRPRFDGRFAVVPAPLATEAGPRVPGALETVARALHPDAFR